MRKIIASLALSAAALLALPAAATAAEIPHLENLPLGGTAQSPSVALAVGQAVNAITEDIAGPQSAQELSSYAADLAQAAADAAAETLRAGQVDAVLGEALSHEGAPYAYGGTTPRGFDCSGFTSYVFRVATGMEFPRTAAAQSGMGESVSLDSLLPGDLLFWGQGSGVYHVGIYVGDGSYIHAAGSGKGVRVQTMDYYCPTFAKRVI